MCTSKCGGACIFLLKEAAADSKESLAELNNLLNNISVCGIPEGTDTNNFIVEVAGLKRDVGRLLDEVNAYTMKTLPGKNIVDPLDDAGNIFEEFSFKERLYDLKQKIHGLHKHDNAIK